MKQTHTTQCGPRATTTLLTVNTITPAWYPGKDEPHKAGNHRYVARRASCSRVWKSRPAKAGMRDVTRTEFRFQRFRHSMCGRCRESTADSKRRSCVPGESTLMAESASGTCELTCAERVGGVADSAGPANAPSRIRSGVLHFQGDDRLSPGDGGYCGETGTRSTMPRKDGS